MARKAAIIGGAFVCLGITLFLVSCAHPPLDPEDMSGADRAACVASGGAVVRDGLAQAQLCIKTFSDSGKACHKAGDCQGSCELPDADAKVGMCSQTDSPFGCHWWLDENGRPTGGMCVD